MDQDSTEKELLILNGARASSRGIPEALHGDTMEDTHECLLTLEPLAKHMASGHTHSNDNPYQGTAGQDLNGKLDVSDSEHAPVKAQDRSFGAKESSSVEQFGNVEDETVVHQYFRLGPATMNVIDVKSKSGIFDPWSRLDSVVSNIVIWTYR